MAGQMETSGQDSTDIMKKVYDNMPELASYSEAERQQIWKECSQRAFRQPPVLLGIVAGAAVFLLSKQLIGGVLGGISGIAIGGAIGGMLIAVMMLPIIIATTKTEVRKKIAE